MNQSTTCIGASIILSCLSDVSSSEENVLCGISSCTLADVEWEGLSGGESDGSRNFRHITPDIGMLLMLLPMLLLIEPSRQECVEDCDPKEGAEIVC